MELWCNLGGIEFLRDVIHHHLGGGGREGGGGGGSNIKRDQADYRSWDGKNILGRQFREYLLCYDEFVTEIQNVFFLKN